MCFSKILKYIPDSGLSRFPLGASVCTQWQVKHRHCSRTCRIQKKSQNFKEKTQCLMNTLYLTSGCPIIQGRARNVGNTVVDKLFNYIYASTGLFDFLLHSHWSKSNTNSWETMYVYIKEVVFIIIYLCYAIRWSAYVYIYANLFPK